MTLPNGDTYSGNFLNEEFNGHGVYRVYQSKLVCGYTGEWKDAKKHGFGTATLADGYKIVG